MNFGALLKFGVSSSELEELDELEDEASEKTSDEVVSDTADSKSMQILILAFIHGVLSLPSLLFYIKDIDTLIRLMYLYIYVIFI